MIISDKQIIYKLPHKLPNDLSAQSSSQNKTFVNTSKKLIKNRNRTFRVVRYFTSKLQFISNILFMIVCYKVYSIQLNKKLSFDYIFDE